MPIFLYSFIKKQGGKKMKKSLNISVSIIISFLFSAAVAFASDTKPITHNFEIGLEIIHINYEEDTINISIDGPMYGLLGDYTLHAENRVMFNVSLEFLFGELDYEGATWAGAPLTADTDDWIVELRSLLGYDFNLRGQHIVTPFIGIGYRYWNDDIGGTGGYEREIEYWYSPIGIKTVSPLSDKWTWGASVEYDHLWDGNTTSHLSDVLAGFNDPDVNQEDGYGVRISLQFRRELTRNRGLIVEPYLRYWEIDRSDNATLTFGGAPTGFVVFEPENDTTIYGLRLSYKF